MLSKCANSGCSALFRYLGEGKIFNLELAPPASIPGPQGETRVLHKVEHFWLCSQCMLSVTLIVENGQLIVRPLRSAPAGDKALAASANGQQK
jgi:hypothetical protein